MREKVNKETGEVKEIPKNLLNVVIVKKQVRENGTRRIQQDFDNCPTMAEQHTGHLTDINYLMEKYKPDELAAYLAVRNQHRQEIVGHDFSHEPNLQEAKNAVYQSRKNFEDLPEDVRKHFQNHLEFLKFIDNPKNSEKMVKLGLLKQKQIDSVKIEDPNQPKINDSNDKKTTT